LSDHDALKKAYAGTNRPVTYIGWIKKIDDKLLIKIGSTINITTRSEDHHNDYGFFNLIYVKDAILHESFEKFLQKHALVSPLLYKEKVKVNGGYSNEVFLMSQDNIKTLINIANKNYSKFSDKEVRANMTELEEIRIKKLQAQADLIRLKLKLAKVKSDGASTSKVIEDEDFEDIDSDEEDEIFADTKRYRVGRGNKYQIYKKDGTLVHTFETVVDATRGNDYVSGASRKGINGAVENNIEYAGYRWMKLKRDMPKDTVQELAPEGNVRTQTHGFVAMLNKSKTKIEKVFKDQKALVEVGLYSGPSGISKAIKNQSLAFGQYFFMMWDNCSLELKTEYLSRETLPARRVAGNSIVIEKLHPKTKNVVKRYSCIEDVIREHRMSRNSLENAIENDDIKHGYKWRYGN
jgi:hypothetical protein